MTLCVCVQARGRSSTPATLDQGSPPALKYLDIVHCKNYNPILKLTK